MLKIFSNHQRTLHQLCQITSFQQTQLKWNQVNKTILNSLMKGKTIKIWQTWVDRILLWQRNNHHLNLTLQLHQKSNPNLYHLKLIFSHNLKCNNNPSLALACSQDRSQVIRWAAKALHRDCHRWTHNKWHNTKHFLNNSSNSSNNL